MEYTVGPVTLQHSPALLKVRVPLARRDGYAVISIYVPSLTMLVIGYLTLFFVRDNFEVRVMTSLTSLLVMATLFTQVAASLPKTSYFKLVDIWLLFCIFSTFFIIVFHIIIDLLLKEVKRQSFTTTTKFSEKKAPLSEKIFLPRIGRDHLRSHHHHQQQEADRYPWQLQEPLQRHKSAPRKSARDQILEEMAEYSKISRKSRDLINCRQKVLMMKRCKFGVTLWTAEKFAKVFMMVVFMIFNIVYWMIAYAA
ncbi:glycine receptor subunit alpha-3-like [Procambarus clarkii]|uniref:glycine receptor subunit alpha-3-like n=1 Tax=Procambarus clarkii TaxID=6728 RepID=UPI0037444631